MKTGRPRDVTPPDDELHRLGDDLVKWATEPTEEKRTAFQFWYALRHGMILKQWKLLKQHPVFSPYYEKARAALSQKLHNDELEKGMAHRYARMYDQELAQEENEEVLFKEKAKKGEEEQKFSLSEIKKMIEQGLLKQE